MPRSSPGAYKVTKSSSTGTRKKVKKVKTPAIKVPDAAAKRATTTTELQRRLDERRKNPK